MSLLLEVLFGFGLFATALLLVFGLFPTSHRATTSTKNLAIASDLAREFMEQELANDFSTISTRPAVDIPVPVTVNGVSSQTTFTVVVEVFPEAAGAAPDNFERKRVLVTVTWPEGTGATRTTRLESYAIQ
ncbi:MAG: hypothetical protein KC910_33635 [Candidatus Eremiobacteraeota bacterium]|nr:hypothetical protein [Candidatus Eremiobacteraeota bacterium]